jgi:hypothetical protein
MRDLLGPIGFPGFIRLRSFGASRFRIKRVELTVACNRDGLGGRLATQGGGGGGGGVARRRWGLGFVERTLPSKNSEAFSLLFGGF